MTPGARLAHHARVQPERAAVVCDERTLTWAQFGHWARRVAQDLSIGVGDIVAVALPNGIEHYVASYAVWLRGGCVLPVAPESPASERRAVLDAAGVTAVLSSIPTDDQRSRPPLPDVIPSPGQAMTSGGSTGRPKVIVDPAPMDRPLGEIPAVVAECGVRPGLTTLVGGALHHNVSFTWSHLVLAEGGTVVVMPRFDASRYVDLVEQRRPAFLPLVPTMMARIGRLDGIAARDFSSVDTVLHTGSACPAWVKRTWFDLVGATRVVEGYGGTEAIGLTLIRGDEWLAHPGSVGRPRHCDIQIRDDDNRPLPAGHIGQIWLRRHGDAPRSYYLGAAELLSDPDGWSTLGDLGSLDDDGYLTIADRRTDLIITGGVNVYPAEVEAVLSQHPHVMDVVVVGLPDDDWGQRVHAVVETHHALDPEELLRYCDGRLQPAKRPKSIAVVAKLPRDSAGKIRRAALVEGVA